MFIVPRTNIVPPTIRTPTKSHIVIRITRRAILTTAPNQDID